MLQAIGPIIFSPQNCRQPSYEHTARRISEADQSLKRATRPLNNAARDVSISTSPVHSGLPNLSALASPLQPDFFSWLPGWLTAGRSSEQSLLDISGTDGATNQGRRVLSDSRWGPVSDSQTVQSVDLVGEQGTRLSFACSSLCARHLRFAENGDLKNETQSLGLAQSAWWRG